MLLRRRCLDSMILAFLPTLSSPCCRKYCGPTPQGRSLNTQLLRAREGRKRGQPWIRRGPLVAPRAPIGRPLISADLNSSRRGRSATLASHVRKKATLTGVALACTIPLRRTFGQPEASECPLIRLEHAAAGSFRHRADLRPCAGISFAGLAPLALLGKQIGVFAFARPEGLRTCQRTRAGRSSEAIASDGIKKNS
jgi:hypothetical protein